MKARRSRKSDRSQTILFAIANPDLSWEESEEALAKIGVIADHKWWGHTHNQAPKYKLPEKPKIIITNVICDKIYKPGMDLTELESDLFKYLSEIGISYETINKKTIERTWGYMDYMHKARIKSGQKII